MRELFLQQCHGCRRQFQTFDEDRFFCSDSCKVRKAILDKEKGEPRGQLEEGEHHCDWCGEPYKPYHGLQRYCGAICSGAAAHRQPFTATCKQCGKDYETTSYQKRYCSENCLRVTLQQRQAAITENRRKKAAELAQEKRKGKSYAWLNRMAEIRRLMDE